MFGQLSDEFVGIDPKGTIAADEFASDPVTYSGCDDEKLTFVAGWNTVATGGLRLMVNAPSGALVRSNDPAVESSGQSKYAFLRTPLPIHGEQAGTWRSQIIRPHRSYVNGFTTDALPSGESVPLVRSQIQRLCPNGCATVLYFEDGHRGPRSSYADALAAEVATGLIGSLTTATSPTDFDTRLAITNPWSLVVYAHQMTEGPEAYDSSLTGRVCGGFQTAIITETRGMDSIDDARAGQSELPAVLHQLVRGRGAVRPVDFTQIVGDGRLLSGTHTLTNNGYTHFSYGQTPGTLGGASQAIAFRSDGLTLGAISATTVLPCQGDSASSAGGGLVHGRAGARHLAAG